jgi:malate/lactate dehydrogenase
MKVSIVGIGKVEAALGLTLISQGLVSELVLIGWRSSDAQAPSVATGEAMDLLHDSAFTRRGRSDFCPEFGLSMSALKNE